MKHSKVLSVAGIVLVRGALSLALVFSLACSFPLFAYASEVNEQATLNEGLGSESSGVTNLPPDGSATSSEQSAELEDAAAPAGDAEQPAEQEDVETSAGEAEQGAESFAALSGEPLAEQEEEAIQTLDFQDPSGTFANAEGVAAAISWTLDSNGTLTITGTGGIGNYKFHKSNGASAFVGGYTATDGTLVTQAAEYESVKTIVIGEGITSLGTSVFSLASGEAVNIQALSLPSTLTAIGDSVFRYIGSIATVTFASTSQLSTIGNYAFQNCSSLATINLPVSVTSMGMYAFQNCTSLTTLSFAEGLESIGRSAFQGCTSLTTLSLPASLTSFGSTAFRNCTSLTTINLAEGLESIGGSAFYDCTSLTTINLPASVTSIGSSAFRNCTSLTTINLPALLSSIESSTFYDCTSLTTINLPASVTSIGSSAFRNCTSLTTINFPASVTSIGSTAFSGCSSLTGLTFVEGLESIGSTAFQDCTNLHISWFPDSLKIIGDLAFSSCPEFPKLSEVSVSAETTFSITWYPSFPEGTNIKLRSIVPAIHSGTFANVEGTADAISWILDAEGTLTITGTGGIGDYKFHKSNPASAFAGGYTAVDGTAVTQAAEYESVKAIVIDEGITSLGVSGFSLTSGEAVNIKTLSLPNTLASIGNSTFDSVNSLETVTFASESQLSSIGASAFKGCTSLALISLPALVSTIESEAFACCTSLATLALAEGLKIIGNSAFYGCAILEIDWFPDSLTSIGVSAFAGCATLPQLDMISLFGETMVDDTAFPEGTKLVFRIPHSIAASGSFANTEGEENAIFWTLENGVLTITGTGGIGSYKFHKSNSASVLTGYSLQDGTIVTQAAEYESIEIIIVGEGITSLGGYSFSLMSGEAACIKMASLPSTLKAIDAFAFRDVGSLETVTFAPEGQLSSIGNYAFQNCISLALTTLPSSLARIGMYSFSGCTSLALASLPASVKSIGYAVFEGCTGFARLPLAEGVESIEGLAFSGCTNLEISWFPNSLASIETSAFANCTALSKLPEVSVYGATSISNAAFPKDTNLVLREAPGYYVTPGIFWSFSNDGEGELALTVFGSGGTWSQSENDFFFANHPEYKAADVKHVVIEEGVTGVPNGRFNGREFTGLESVHLSSTVEAIEGGAFSESPLRSLTIAGNSKLTTIGQGAFEGCVSLTSLDFSNTQLTTTGFGAFRSMLNKPSGLQKISLPLTYTVVGESVFNTCSSLTSVTLPAVTFIGKTAFGSSAVETVYVSRNIEYLDRQMRSVNAFENAKTVVVISGSSTTPLEGLDYPNISYEFYKDTTNSDDAYALSSVGQTIAFTCANLGVPVAYKITQLGAVEDSSDAMRDFKARAYDEDTDLLGTIALEMEDANGGVVEGLGRAATLAIPVEGEAYEGTEVQVYAWTNGKEGAAYAQTATVTGGVVQITNAQPHTSYAVFTMKAAPVTYTVSFASNGGGAVTSQTIEEGKLASAPNAPVRRGYTFTGWYTTSALSETFAFSTPIVSNTTLYAGWERVANEETPVNNNDDGPDTIVVVNGTGGGTTQVSTQNAAATSGGNATAEASSSNSATGSNSNSASAGSEEDPGQTSEIEDAATALAGPAQDAPVFQWWWIIAALAVVAAFFLGALLRRRRREDR